MVPRPRKRTSCALQTLGQTLDLPSRVSASAIRRGSLIRPSSRRRSLAASSRPRARPPRGQAEQSGDLGRESLGGGDADLRAGLRRHHHVGFPRDGRRRHVARSPACAALRLRLAQRGQGVGRLARLRDGHDSASSRAAARDSGTRRRCRSRTAGRPAARPVPADQAGVVGGAAGDDVDAASFGEVDGQRRAARPRPSPCRRCAERVGAPPRAARGSPSA